MSSSLYTGHTVSQMFIDRASEVSSATQTVVLPYK